jgi:hypothetical protein
MRRIAILALLASAACAPASSESAPASRPGHSRVITTGSGVDIQLAEDGPAAAKPVSASPAQVWAALPGVYEAVGITGAAGDERARVYGVRKLMIRRRLGKHALSRYLSCGNTPGGGLVADSYRVQLTVLTSVRPGSGSGSLVQTEVIASGHPTEGTSTSAVRCASTGVLEGRIAELLSGPAGS